MPRIAVLGLLAGLLAACGSTNGNGAPRIKSFTADPDTVAAGGLSVLRWSVEGATSLTITPDVGDVNDVLEFGVRPTRTTTYTLHAKNTAGESTATAAITVTGTTVKVASLSATAPAEATAGVPVSLTVKALDASGTLLQTYAGTIHFTSTDPAAALPADTTFNAAVDRGQKTVQVTFYTAGTRQVHVADAAAAVQADSNVVVVTGAAVKPAGCAISGVPTGVAAGTAITAHVRALDGSGNVVTSYAGTMSVASSDGAATLPAPYTFAAADAGEHDFSVTLKTQGAQTITIADPSIASLKCTANVTVTPPASTKLAFSGLPAGATPGAAVTFTLTATDNSGTTLQSYAGTVSFTSTGPNTQLPAAYTFTGTDKGVHPFSATFQDLGSQTITATDAATPAFGTSAAVLVHGLAYTDPPAGTGKVRLVRNAASTAGTAVLDLVVAAPFSGYSVMLNLPVDPARVKTPAQAPLMTAGTALDPGSSPAAFKAALPPSGPLTGVLVSALSQKAGGTGAVVTDASLAAGQVLYTLQLDLASGAAAGVAFDGAAPGALFRASLRDRLGQEVVSQADFAVGKLEVK